MKYILLLIFVIISSCSEVPALKQNNSTVVTLPSVNCEVTNGWAVPLVDIIDGGVGQGGIPAINQPDFIMIDQVDFLVDDELVILVKVGLDIKIYPQRIMDFHEIVNDIIDDVPISITFCPISGTAVAWEREVSDLLNNFSVSGLLYNANLVATDEQSNSNWSQVLGVAINGELACEKLSNISIVDINWGAAKKLYPTAKVLSTNTGFNFNYFQTPLSYNQPIDAQPLFPVNFVDDRLNSYERVHIVTIEGKSRAYRFSDFEVGPKIIFDRLENQDLMIIGNKSENFIVSYLINETVGYKLNFIEGKEYSITTEGGDRHNLFGEIYEGPNVGGRLKSKGLTGYWFSLSAFYPELELYSSFQLGG